jgi:hypothetical protein
MRRLEDIMRTAWFTLVGISLLGGCASVQNSEAAVPIDAQGNLAPATTMGSGLRISGEELRPLASTYFGVLEVTFENPTAEWVRVDRVTLDFGSAAKNSAIVIPAGNHLEAFVASTEQRNAIRSLNRQTAFALTALGGTLVAGISPESGPATAGGTVAVGSLSALAVDTHVQSVEKTEHVARLPESHLLAGAFTVPPGLFVKRWIVLQTKQAAPTECIGSVTLAYELANASRERVLLTFKAQRRESEWQTSPCHPAPEQARSD